MFFKPFYAAVVSLNRAPALPAYTDFDTQNSLCNFKNTLYTAVCCGSIIRIVVNWTDMFNLKTRGRTGIEQKTKNAFNISYYYRRNHNNGYGS